MTAITLPALNAFVAGAAIVASISSMLLGYDVGVTSGALLFITDDFKLTDFQKEVFVSSLSLISLFGALLSGCMSDAIGRRSTMMFASGLFFLGSATMATAPTYAALMVGRLITGVAVGFGFTTAPIYTAELAPPTQRGMLVSLSEVCINIGVLVGYLASYVLESLPPGINWRAMLALGGLPAILLGLGVLFLPESPRWLVMQGRMKEALSVLEKTSIEEGEAEGRLAEILDAAVSGRENGLHGALEVEMHVKQSAEEAVVPHGAQVEDKEGLLSDQAGTDHGGPWTWQWQWQGREVWRELVNPSPNVKRMLFLCLGTNFFQQVTGIDAAVYYSPVIFQQAGLHGRSALLAATVGIGLVKTCFILLAMLLLDSVGRRPLLLISTAGMTLSLLCESFGFLLLHQGGDEQAEQKTQFIPPAVIIFASCCFVAFFSIGLGPINWVLTSEIFPLRLRAQAFSLGTAVNRLASGAVALTFLSLGDTVGPAGCFLLFSGFGLCSVIFFYLYAPETKGKSLEEIERLFDSHESDPASTPLQ